MRLGRDYGWRQKGLRRREGRAKREERKEREKERRHRRLADTLLNTGGAPDARVAGQCAPVCVCL